MTALTLPLIWFFLQISSKMIMGIVTNKYSSLCSFKHTSVLYMSWAPAFRFDFSNLFILDCHLLYYFDLVTFNFL